MKVGRQKWEDFLKGGVDCSINKEVSEGGRTTRTVCGVEYAALVIAILVVK